MFHFVRAWLHTFSYVAVGVEVLAGLVLLEPSGPRVVLLDGLPLSSKNSCPTVDATAQVVVRWMFAVGELVSVWPPQARV